MQSQDLYPLAEYLEQLNIPFSDHQITQLVQFGNLLQEWNQKMNLTAITDSKDIVTRHFIDSITGQTIFDFRQPDISLLDLGTGAGFPGIPLKIIFPGLQITLLDSLKKRIGFLDTVIKELELSDIRTIHGRAEDTVRDKAHREQYHVCTSRAVANLSTLSEYCLPFVKTGGYFLSYKGSAAEDEIKAAKRAISILGGKVERKETLLLPGEGAERTLILIKKETVTPAKYPRQAGTPSRKPL